MFFVSARLGNQNKRPNFVENNKKSIHMKKKEAAAFMEFVGNLLFDAIQEKLGEDATEEEIEKYVSSLTPKDIEKLAEESVSKLRLDLQSASDGTKNDFPLPFMNGDDEEFDEEYDGDEEYDEDDSTHEYDSCGCLECMPAKEIKKYTLRIKLRGISPSIWRKIVVPSSIKLTSLAEIIIEAMGWWNEHLHQFRKGNAYYATKYMEEDEAGWSNSRWGGDYSIAHLLKKEKDNTVFEYDYGDSWEHDVTLSKIEDFEEDETPYVRLLGGKRACPPEDCGGVPGYYDLCEAMKHPRSAHAKEMKEWLGHTFNPEEFDFEETEMIIDGYNDFDDDDEEEDTDD